MNGIKYIPHSAIDKSKWDNCISQSANGLIYTYSYYLDTMANGQWDALVKNDYEMVMPLPWRKKMGITYLYQPAFTAMLGVFGKKISPQDVQEFLASVPVAFKYIDIYLNTKNYFDTVLQDSYTRVNYELNLQASYAALKEHYRENLLRNIKKSGKYEVEIKKGFPVADVINLAKEFRKKNDNTTDEDYHNFSMLYSFLHKNGHAITYGIRHQDKLLSSAVFFMDTKRAYYILVGNHPDGKTAGASHSLIDAFIKDYAGKKLLLDFEGSDVPSLAFFYSSFGAAPVMYPAIKSNRLPALIKWLKK